MLTKIFVKTFEIFSYSYPLIMVLLVLYLGKILLTINPDLYLPMHLNKFHKTLDSIQFFLTFVTFLKTFRKITQHNYDHKLSEQDKN